MLDEWGVRSFVTNLSHRSSLVYLRESIYGVDSTWRPFYTCIRWIWGTKVEEADVDNSIYVESSNQSSIRNLSMWAFTN